jgi:hypothetical protein
MNSRELGSESCGGSCVASLKSSNGRRKRVWEGQLLKKNGFYKRRKI